MSAPARNRASVDECVEILVTAAPPLSEEQRATLRGLLAPSRTSENQPGQDEDEMAQRRDAARRRVANRTQGRRAAA